MSFLSPRLSLKVAQKQILTPGLVQMVTVLQLNRLELKEMITQEIVKNPVLEEAGDDAGEETTPEELLPLLEAEHVFDPADKQLLDAAILSDANSINGSVNDVPINGNLFPDAEESAAATLVSEGETASAINDPALDQPAATDPFDEIDFGSLDPFAGTAVPSYVYNRTGTYQVFAEIMDKDFGAALSPRATSPPGPRSPTSARSVMRSCKSCKSCKSCSHPL